MIFGTGSFILRSGREFVDVPKLVLQLPPQKAFGP